MKQAWATELQVRVDQIGGYSRIRLGGEGETGGATLLEETLGQLVEKGERKLILDCRDVRYLGPRCFESLERAVLRLQEAGGVLVIVDQSLPVERSLKLLDAERLAHIVPSVSQAVAYLDWHE